MERKKDFIAWAPYSQRSQALARELDMNLHFIHYFKFQRPLYAPLKYILQTMHTLALLLKDRPHLVFVQDPPLFASLSVFIYTSFTFGKARYIIDAHTGAFLHPFWKPFRWLQKFLYRRAEAVITTNSRMGEHANSLGADSLVLAGPPIAIPDGDSMPLSDKFNLVLINSFSPDEPLSAVLDAVKARSDVHLYVTGDVSKSHASLRETGAVNVTFTGFLSQNDYHMLLRGADAVIVVTDTDNTLQLGAMEAIALGKPLIVSDLSFLRSHLCKGAIHVPNTSKGIYAGISKMQKNYLCLSREILELNHIHKEDWNISSRKLLELLAGLDKK